MSEQFKDSKGEVSKAMLIRAMRKEIVEAYTTLRDVQKKLRTIDELLYGIEYGLEAVHEEA